MNTYWYEYRIVWLSDVVFLSSCIVMYHHVSSCIFMYRHVVFLSSAAVGCIKSHAATPRIPPIRALVTESLYQYTLWMYSYISIHYMNVILWIHCIFVIISCSFYAYIIWVHDNMNTQQYVRSIRKSRKFGAPVNDWKKSMNQDVNEWINTVTGWRRLIGFHKLQIISTKEPQNTGHFCRTWLIKIRDPMSLGHPLHMIMQVVAINEWVAGAKSRSSGAPVKEWINHSMHLNSMHQTIKEWINQCITHQCITHQCITQWMHHTWFTRYIRLLVQRLVRWAPNCTTCIKKWMLVTCMNRSQMHQCILNTYTKSKSYCHIQGLVSKKPFTLHHFTNHLIGFHSRDFRGKMLSRCISRLQEHDMCGTWHITYVDAHTHTRTHQRTHAFARARTPKHTCTRTCAYAHAHMHVYMHVLTHAQVYAHAHALHTNKHN